MEAALNNDQGINIGSKLIAILACFEPSNIQRLLYDAFDNMSNDNPINYVGELNKNDVMH